MSKYMYLFRGGEEQRSQLSEAEMQSHMQKWVTWMDRLAKSGKLVDGSPLRKNERKVVSGSEKIVSDGPFAEGKELVGGYLIVNAEKLDDAAEIAKDCPIFEHNGTVEVAEILPM